MRKSGKKEINEFLKRTTTNNTIQLDSSVTPNFDIINNLRDVKPNIRIVHLLLNDDISPERQVKSIKSISQLASRGIDYVQVWNNRWTDTPPRETFTNPENFDTIPITPAHYGNFRAFADSAASHFSEDLDALIFCEGDAGLTESIQDTVDAINTAHRRCKELNIAYFSFGSRFDLQNKAIDVSGTIEYIEDSRIHMVTKVVGAQMVMITSNYRKFLLDRFVFHVWTSADMFMNNIFMGKFNIGIFDKPYALQFSGVSVIDKYTKKYVDVESLDKNI